MVEMQSFIDSSGVNICVFEVQLFGPMNAKLTMIREGSEKDYPGCGQIDNCDNFNPFSPAIPTNKLHFSHARLSFAAHRTHRLRTKPGIIAPSLVIR